MKQFFTLAEIAAANSPDLPRSVSSLKRKVAEEHWQSRSGLARKAPGKTKAAWEYHISLLPPIAQARLALIHSAPANDDFDEGAERKKALWARFEGLSNRQKEICRNLSVVRTFGADGCLI